MKKNNPTFILMIATEAESLKKQSGILYLDDGSALVPEENLLTKDYIVSKIQELSNSLSSKKSVTDLALHLIKKLE